MCVRCTTHETSGVPPMIETAYCGPPPLPATFWSSWNYDPLLLIALMALFGAATFSNANAEKPRFVLIGAVIVLAIAFISPLCALATALFSARVAHHVLMIAVAAPLLALAAPRWRLPPRVSLTALVLAHSLAVWLWHAPAPYGWAISGYASYWLMEVSLLVTAFWLWGGILHPEGRPPAALAALFATIGQMGLLGAILTFSRTPLYDPHTGVTAPFGLSQLEDQQLAGLIMWLPGSIPYLMAACFIVARLFPQAAGEPRERDA
jgi:putative membrane protein